MTKRSISFLVAAMLLLTFVPAAAFAKTETNENSRYTREPIGKATDFVPRQEASNETAKSIASWDFEEDPLENGWTFRSDDGDGYNWAWTTAYSHSSSHSIFSESYFKNGGRTALDPDNWAISPEFDVPEEGASVSFWARNYSSYYKDSFSIYVIINDEVDGETDYEIDTDISDVTDAWVELTYNLPTIANGQTVSFAIRHHNSYNMWAIFIDDITISEPIDDSTVTEIGAHGFPTRVYGGDTAGDAVANIEPDDDDLYTVEAYVIDENMVQYSDDYVLEADTQYVICAELHPVEGYHFFEDADLYANYGNIETLPGFTYVSEDGLTAFITVLITALADRPIYGWYFEDDAELDGWSAYDYDGDDYNWEWFCGEYAAEYAYEGQGWMGSASYYYEPSKGALTPDNFLFTPVITLPEGTSTLSFFAAGLERGYAGEHFAVYVMDPDAESIEEIEEIFPETEAAYLYINYTADLSAYAGQDVVIAFRHFNCSGIEWLRLDQVEIFEGVHEPIESPLITRVDIIDFVTPKYGAAPDYNATVPDGVHYDIVEMSWWKYHDGESNIMEDGDVFNDTEIYYYAYFIVLAEDGYDFDMPSEPYVTKDTTVFINGSDEYVDEYYLSPCTRALYIYTILFQVTEPQPIDLVEINDFVVPEWGADPFLDVTVPEDANYEIVNTYWEWWGDEDGMLIDEIMGEGDVFDNPDVAYYQFFELAPLDGYYFADIDPDDKAVSDDYLTVLINGDEEYVDYFWFHEDNGNLLVCSIDFFVDRPIELIDTIEINDFVIPEWGEAPFYDVTVPEDAHYSIVYTDWNWYSYMYDDGDMMGDGDLFDNEEYVYYQYFQVVPDEGYAFSEDVTVTINGDPAIVDNYDWNANMGYEWIFTIDYSVSAPLLITEVDILDLAKPRYGRNPDYEVSVPDGTNYTVTEMSWNMYDPELGDVTVLPEDLFLNLDAVYYAIFVVDPAEDWQFDEEDLVVTINGRADIVEFSFVYEGQLYIMTIDCEICLFGDVNLDGTVTAEDALLAMRYAMGLIDLTEEQLYQMEVDFSETYDLADATLILRYAMGIIDHLPVEEPYLYW